MFYSISHTELFKFLCFRCNVNLFLWVCVCVCVLSAAIGRCFYYLCVCGLLSLNRNDALDCLSVEKKHFISLFKVRLEHE